MKRMLADAELEKLSAHVAEQMGLYFPPSKWRNLEQAFRTAAHELGYQDLRECVAWFASSPPTTELIASMACYLTIGETYFMRELRCFEFLEQQIIPDITGKRQGSDRRLRIWSAGCATGEEPYSIAILLHRMREPLRDWDISILATDINPHALRKAREGVYTNWSFRNTPASFKEHYFRKTGEGQFELLPTIRKMVKFASFNLVEDRYPSLDTDTNAIDVIFCRNVLMYFTPQLAAKVVERFHRCLLDGGWLFVSPCETANPFFSQFEPVTFPDAILYRKAGAGEAETRGSGDTGKRRHGEAEKRGSGEAEQLKNISPIHPFPVSPIQEKSPVPPHSDSPFREVVSPYQEAMALYERGAYGEAAERVASHLARDRNDTRALTLLCRIRANEGRLAEALSVSDQALTVDKLSAGLHYLRAVILQEQGLDDEAAASLKKALYLDQDLVLAYFTLANLEQRKGRVKESRRHFGNALSLLDRYGPDEVVPESDGMLARRLREIIKAAIARQ